MTATSTALRAQLRHARFRWLTKVSSRSPEHATRQCCGSIILIMSVWPPPVTTDVSKSIAELPCVRG